MDATDNTKVRFTARADAAVLNVLKAIARSERRTLQSVIEEALIDLIAKKRAESQPDVRMALQASKQKFDGLYREFAK